MKLFLSSLNLGQHEPLIPAYKKLLSTNRSGRKRPFILTIHNANDYKGEVASQLRNKEDLLISKHGIDYQRIDLRDYEIKPKALEKLALSADGVFFGGGNTYYLMYWVLKVGMDKLIKTGIQKGLVFGGGSAGAIIAGPTLRHFDNLDSLEVAPKVVWDGLGLIDFVVLPHVDSPKYGEAVMESKDDFIKDGYKVELLGDYQALIDDNNRITKIGELRG